jgi:hypothetical protein
MISRHFSRIFNSRTIARPMSQLSTRFSNSYNGNAKTSPFANMVYAAATFTTALIAANQTVANNDKVASSQSGSESLGIPYPQSEPYFKKLLKVSDIHSVYYAVYGNPEGKPVLFVHGGPGGGTTPSVS